MPVSTIEGSPISAVVTNPRLPDNPIIACNEAFETLTGYSKAEAIGRNCRFLSRLSSNPELAGRIREGVAHRRPIVAEITNFKKTGAEFRNALLIVPIFGESGELTFFLGSQTELHAELPQVETDAAVALARLSERQREVLRAMIAGMRNKEIAARLSITERTVKLHRAAAIRALGVRTTVDAIRVALLGGWGA